MSLDRIPEDPRTIDIEDEHEVRRFAEAFEVGPEDVREAVAQVGTNRKAVEIWLGCAGA